MSKSPLREESLDDARRTLRFIMGDACENFTGGLGSCYKAGRSPGAEFEADACCVRCIAHRFLTCGEVPREDRHIDLDMKEYKSMERMK